jgi:hypothetical protein
MDAEMNSEERLNLQKMIKVNDVEDQTGLIRQTKHSDLIREQVKDLMYLKTKYPRLAKSNPGEFETMCLSKCQFLFNQYTDIFNKVNKGEIDFAILNQFLDVLKLIEDGKIDQHEGSFKVGKLLKHLYVDSALKKTEKMDEIENKKNSKKNNKEPVTPREISWHEFKLKNNM